MSLQQIIAIIIFLCTMTAIITGKVHNTVAALTGAVLLVLTHILSIEDCVNAVDVETICILVGMMLLVAVVKNSGIFEYIAIKAAKLAKGRPWPIMVIFIIITAVLSGMLDNVTTVLLVGPMTLAITNILKVDPVPYIITQIMASNIGGTATLIGDPPNIMIGSAAKLSFVDFIMNTGFATLFVVIVGLICMYFIYGRKLFVTDESIAKVMQLDEQKAIKDRKLMHESVVVIIIVALCFIFHDQLGVESCTIAIAAACLMLLIGGQEPEEIVLSVEWPTILFFIGLFIVVGGLKKVGVITLLANGLLSLTGGNMIITMMVILWVSAIVSSFLDNIPFVATLIPMILTMQSEGMDVAPIWWALSLGACLGGNGTLIGASANVVLSGISKNNGHPITFAQYFKIGFPMMILSIVVCSIFLLVRFA
ncbi:SLC13 family permease [Anaerostipes sp. MSJ-23]|uniref:SLC13 family permease n=1 Tax=unclassified Anaerostipes TaxID=2635253 RepID=UPI001C0FA0D8|nr:ArsB/NhaD family transporter [Anaerostipes sp. MSJ-23]MBU5460522.1 ArsB/NhaD family transporter [Anaerostipes sp. MSJ-23]